MPIIEQELAAPKYASLDEELKNNGENEILLTASSSKSTSSMTKAIFSLCKTAVGVGLLLMPSSFSILGIILGPLVCIFIAVSSGFAAYILAKAGHRLQNYDYVGIGKQLYGKFGEFSALLILLLMLFGPMIAYIALIGNYMTDLSALANQEHAWYTSRAFFIFTTSAVIIFPLSLFKTMDKLGNVSILGMVGMFYIVMLTIVHFFIDLSANLDLSKIQYFAASSKGLIASTTIISAFESHTSVLPLVETLKKPTPRRVLQFIAISTTITCVIYLVTGIAGYLHFGPETPEDILNAVKPPPITYIIARIILTLVNSLSFPLLVLPARSCVEWPFYAFLPAFMARIAGGKRASLLFHFLLTFLIVFITAIVAYFSTSIQTIFGLVGAVCGSLLVYVLPSLYYLKCKGKDALESKLFSMETVACYFNIIIGILFLVAGVVSWILSLQ